MIEVIYSESTFKCVYMCIAVLTMCEYSQISVRNCVFSGSEFVSLAAWLLLAGLATGQDVQ